MRRITLALAVMVILALVIGAAGCTEKKTGVSLQLTQPQDGEQVSTSTVLVVGKTIPDAVVSASVNDDLQIATFAQDGEFSFGVDVEEGPNFIEVISSDPYDNQESALVSLIYIPQQ